MELYGRIRRACHVEGMSIREAARLFGLHRDTVRKMLRYSVAPGYQRRGLPRRPKLDPFKGVIDQILQDDLGVSKKQRHTAKRIYERLRDEHSFPGKYTIVKDYVQQRRLRMREMFVPLSHPPGHGQADFGEALVVIGGVKRKAHFLAVDLPHSDACFVKAYPAETTEAFCDGHNAAFAFFSGVPQSMLYDNTTIAVARILGDGRRQRTRAFAELQSHYLFEDRFGRPGKGNDKGKVEGLVGYARRNFFTPIPSFDSFDALNVYLEEQCHKRRGDRLRGHKETIGERLERDRQVLLALPQVPYDACDKHATRVSCPGVSVIEPPFSIHAGLGHRLRLPAIGEIIPRPLPRHRHSRPDIAAAAVGRTPPIRTDQLGRSFAAQLDPRAGREHQRPFYHSSWQLAGRILVDGRTDAGASLRLGVGGPGKKGPGARH